MYESLGSVTSVNKVNKELNRGKANRKVTWQIGGYHVILDRSWPVCINRNRTALLFSETNSSIRVCSALPQRIMWHSRVKLNVELKRQNRQANWSITFYKDSDTTLAKPGKLFFLKMSYIVGKVKFRDKLIQKPCRQNVIFDRSWHAWPIC